MFQFLLLTLAMQLSILGLILHCPFVVGQNIFEFMLDKVVFPLLPSISFEMLKGMKRTEFPVVYELCALEMHARWMNDVSSSGNFTDNIK